MTVLIGVTSYLLIGAIIGWKDSILVEHVIGNALKSVDDTSVNFRKVAIAACITLIILVAPILELWITIAKLKSKLGR